MGNEEDLGQQLSVATVNSRFTSKTTNTASDPLMSLSRPRRHRADVLVRRWSGKREGWSRNP